MPRRSKLTIIILTFSAFILLLAGFVNEATAQPLPIPNIDLTVEQSDNPQQVVDSIKLLVLLTVLSLVPAFLIMMTSFTRIVIVLSFVRNALGTQQTPPNQVLIGLALFLTVFIMTPVYTQVNDKAVKPYLENKVTQEEAMDLASEPIKKFLLKHTREKDLALFIKASKAERPKNQTDLPLSVVIPAFVISELKTAFQMGFLIYLPFLIVDMVVASTLMSMGMFMLPPIMISLPFKVLLFVMVDGWHLIIKSLLESFGVG